MSWFLKHFFNIDPPDKEAYRDKIIEEKEIYEQQLDQQQLPSLARQNVSDTPIASIEFYIDTKNGVNIRYNWKQKDELAAKHLAQMLYYINRGELEHGCVHVLQKTAEQEPENQLFIKEILKTWKEIKDENEVFIKPSEVFQTMAKPPGERG